MKRSQPKTGSGRSGKEKTEGSVLDVCGILQGII